MLPARDAAGTLRRQLDALDRQTFRGAFRVVVVDNCSKDRTADIAATYRPATYRLRVIRESNVGINFVRNAGLAAAPDGKVFLCDADDEVAQDWLEGMVGALEPGVWVAGALDYCRLNSARTRHVWNAPSRSVHHQSDPYMDDTRGCNCGFLRTMWAELGGFDERLSGTGGDETEFFMRAHHAGYRQRHVATALVGYRLRPGVGRMVQQRYRQGRNQIRMMRLPGGRLLPRRHTFRSGVGGLLKVLAVAPRDLVLANRRYQWVAAVSRQSGRLVGLGQRRSVGDGDEVQRDHPCVQRIVDDPGDDSLGRSTKRTRIGSSSSSTTGRSTTPHVSPRRSVTARIRVMITTHGGVSAARNLALREARGEMVIVPRRRRHG